MHLESPVITSVEQQPNAELAARLHQLRRLKNQPQAQPASQHLNSAIQVAGQEAAGGEAAVSYIFIGLVPASN